MNLNVHERNADGDYIERVDGRNYLHAQELVDIYRHAKRFTGAELAAEYWRKNGDFESCTDGYRVADDGYAYESEVVEAGRLDTLRRFATLSHYEEEES